MPVGQHTDRASQWKLHETGLAGIHLLGTLEGWSARGEARQPKRERAIACQVVLVPRFVDQLTVLHAGGPSAILSDRTDCSAVCTLLRYLKGIPLSPMLI